MASLPKLKSSLSTYIDLKIRTVDNDKNNFNKFILGISGNQRIKQGKWEFMKTNSIDQLIDFYFPIVI